MAISGRISNTTNISGKVNSGGGTLDHSKLNNRNIADQHSIAAITGLSDALEKSDEEIAEVSENLTEETAARKTADDNLQKNIDNITEGKTVIDGNAIPEATSDDIKSLFEEV